MNRRHFLKSLAAVPLLAGPSRLLAAPGAGDAKFLLVFLRGGYDAAHLLVPTHSHFYYEARPHIAIAPPGKELNTALALDDAWGLHPALRDSLYPMFQRQQLAFVPFAGTDDLTRSHFETQDSIELGQPIGGSRDYRSGFMNRLAAALGNADAMAFTEQLPIACRGALAMPNLALKQLSKPALDARQSAAIASMYRQGPLADAVKEGLAVRDEVQQELAAEMDAASRSAVSAKGFELEARRVARLMRERYSLGFIDVGGWDTHVGQGGANGYLANRFDELGRGLAALADEFGPAWNKTVVVVISEFGRTFRENGNGGTDHGHGSVYWVLGGKVHGGRVAGEQIDINAQTLFQNRDYPVLNDYRAILASVWARQFGLTESQLQTVFPKYRPADFQLI